MWQNRPDPKGLSRQRRSAYPKRRAKRKKCPECKRRTDSHAKDCSNSLEVRTRRELLERHGVDAEVFAVLLFFLAKRYADRKLNE